MNPTFQMLLNKAQAELAECYQRNTITLAAATRMMKLRLEMIDFIFDVKNVPRPANQSKEHHEYEHFVQGYNNLRKRLDLREKRA